MKNTILILLILFLANGCKDKEPEITSEVDIDAEIKAYFVDYEVGTKWIYQDTIDLSNFDTIELTQIQPYNTNRKGVLEKGYILHYKARKNRDFKVSVSRGQKVNFYINLYTDVTASGAVKFENYNGKWADWLNYYDSIAIETEKYYEVIRGDGSGGEYSLVHLSKNKGIVFYFYSDYSGGISKGGNYYLINTLKP
jgi:hypothetical protein